MEGSERPAPVSIDGSINAPGQRYAALLDERGRALAEAERRDRGVALVRLLAFAAGALLLALAFFGPRLSLAFVLAPGALFVALIVVHERVLRRLERARLAVRFYERGLLRLEERWRGQGASGARFLDPAHPYAADLDVFGEGSLFERLSLARTEAGERALAGFLTTTAPLDVVRARQDAVRELTGRLDLREDLFVAGEGARLDEPREGARGASLEGWAARPPRALGAWLPVTGALLSMVALVALSLWGLGVTGPSPSLLAILALIGFALALRPRCAPILSSADAAARELQVFSRLLARIERERFADPHLASLRQGLDVDGVPASQQIARLARLIELLESRRNVFFAPLAGLLLWGTQIAFLLERWRARVGPAIPRWLSVVGELEALSSMAGYAFERPADPFPELVDEGPCFAGEALSHPLLPDARAVRNDVALFGARRLLVVSGSNMSGKSTLLRTVGANAVLALAGAPVRARSLRTSSLSVGATLRIQDSLAEGASRFYAEITRIKQLMDLARERPPLLFLLDEILHGTNSHDRAIGAEAIVRGLLERGAFGLVTTHDLALARLADDLGETARNVHFEDVLEDGEMVFDYRLKEGVVTRSNAIELMRAVGLEV